MLKSYKCIRSYSSGSSSNPPDFEGIQEILTKGKIYRLDPEINYMEKYNIGGNHFWYGPAIGSWFILYNKLNNKIKIL
jgi:hypothetical protein